MYCALCEVVMCITCKETSHARCLQKWDEEAILCEYVTTSLETSVGPYPSCPTVLNNVPDRFVSRCSIDVPVLGCMQLWLRR